VDQSEVCGSFGSDFACVASAWARSEKGSWSFSGTDEAFRQVQILISDGAGNFYGQPLNGFYAGAGRGGRTPMTRRSTDFESVASASSAIPAWGGHVAGSL
jgi:hypothetical protein